MSESEKTLIAEVLTLQGDMEIIEWESKYALKLLSGMCWLAPKLDRTCKVTPMEGYGLLIKKVRNGFYVQQMESKDILKMRWEKNEPQEGEELEEDQPKMFMNLERAVQPADLPPSIAKAFEKLRALGKITR